MEDCILRVLSGYLFSPFALYNYYIRSMPIQIFLTYDRWSTYIYMLSLEIRVQRKVPSEQRKNVVEYNLCICTHLLRKLIANLYIL